MRLWHGGTGYTITDEKGPFQLIVARKDLTEYSQLYAVAWYENDNDHYLKAEIPIVPSKTDTYVVRLKRLERIRGGKFR